MNDFAGTGIQVEITGDKLVAARLWKLRDRVEHPRRLYQAIGQTLETSIAQRMKREVDPDGNKWPPLADSTLLARMRRYGVQPTRRRKKDGTREARARRNLRTDQGNTRAGAIRVLARIQMLRDTGVMAGSLHHTASDTEARVGFGIRYAMYHEWGSLRVDNRPPRRGLLTSDPATGRLSRGDTNDVLALILDWVEGVVNG